MARGEGRGRETEQDVFILGFFHFCSRPQKNCRLASNRALLPVFMVVLSTEGGKIHNEKKTFFRHHSVRRGCHSLLF